MKLFKSLALDHLDFISCVQWRTHSQNFRSRRTCKWWTIAFLIPFLNLVALWIFASARWPAIDHTEG